MNLQVFDCQSRCIYIADSCEWEKLANYLNLSCSAALLVVVLPVFLLLVLIVAVAAFFAFRSAITKYK